MRAKNESDDELNTLIKTHSTEISQVSSARQKESRSNGGKKINNEK